MCLGMPPADVGGASLETRRRSPDLLRSDAWQFVVFDGEVPAAASNAGYRACWGYTTRLSSGAKPTQGRQVALLGSHSASSAKPTDVSPDNDADVVLLRTTGRWVERLIAVGGEKGHIMVAALYGYSGASTDKQKEADNERLIQAAILRAMQVGQVRISSLRTPT